MADAPPIPKNIWERLVAFLRDGRTGEIVLNVHRGKVSDASFKERIRDEADRLNVSGSPNA